MEQYKKTLVVFVGIVAVIAVGFVLQQLAFVLPHLILAIFIGNIFNPMIDWMRKYKVPLPVIIVVILLVVAASLTGVAYALYLGSVSVETKAPEYGERLAQLFQGASDIIRESSQTLYGKPIEFNISHVLNVEKLPAMLYAVAGSFVGVLGELMLVLLFLIFVLAEARIFRLKIRKAFRSENAEKTLEVVNRIDNDVRQYMLSKLLINTVNGAANWLVLAAFGVDFALFSAVLAFLLNFIPNIGTFISLGFPILVVLLQFDSVSTIVLIVVLLVLVEFVIGNVLEPRVMGHSLDLSPLVVLVSLIFWGWLWGGWGMIMAVPITSVLKIVLQNIDSLKPVALLMSETPRSPRSQADTAPQL